MLDAFEAAAGKRTDITAHVERFASATAPATSAGYRVRLERSQREFAVEPGSKLLDVLRGAGAAIETSCEQGVCGTCETRVVSGIPDHRDCILSDAEKSSNQTMMVCCSGSKSDLLVLDL
jgi:vanillate O-demethylase ferredoxin subunit